MNARTIKMCSLGGPFVAIFMFLALWPLAHFIPPPSPANDAQWYYNFYTENLLGVRLGGIAFMFSATCICLFVASIVSLTRVMEGQTATWTYVVILSSAMVATLFFFAGVLYCLLMFRPERSPEQIYLLSDLAWITLVIPSFPATLQAFAVAFATLNDPRPKPIMPRWSAYFSIWIGIIYLPGSFVAMFITGPFAWNGLLAFWLPAITFGLWCVVYGWLICTRVTDELLASPREA
ncbi:MAG: hypothetical protein COA43_00850 [Robiginitomaculum sp.]|nr:MAG: hypothetical protein COA43_00850 [Robiginitomaculum sp.]